MTNDKENLHKYRIEWRQSLGGGTFIINAIHAYFENEHDAEKIANALELVSEGYQAKAVPLNTDTGAAVVALGVTAALDEVMQVHMAEQWRHSDLSVNRTKRAREFCIRTLISRDLAMIEGELRKRFAVIEDIGCSEGDDPLPDDPPNKWPNKDGMHEWVCILRLRNPQVQQDDLPDSVTVQWAVCWCQGSDSPFTQATGKELMGEATDEEALAYAATEYAYLALLAHELGGGNFESHSELCEDGVRWIGQPWSMHLTGKIKGDMDALF